MASPFDIWDQALLTDLVVKPLQAQFEDQPFLGAQIAPIKSIQSRIAKLQVASVKPFGKGQFKAPDATPPLYKPDMQWREEVIELALLEEMERISGEDWLRLSSGDEMTRKAAGVDLVDRGRILQIRNERLSEWMRWQVFLNGVVTIPYDGGRSALQIDYGFAAGHKPVAGTLWSDTTNSDPIADLETWSSLLADDSGFHGVKCHMTSKTWNYIVKNAKIKALLTDSSRRLMRPTREDINELATSFSAKIDFIINDNGYRDEGSSAEPAGLTTRTKYMADNKILLTTEYSVDGMNIAETLDGQVLVVEGFNNLAIRQGPQSETILDPMSKNQFFRQASARMVRVNMPECFLVARVA